MSVIVAGIGTDVGKTVVSTILCHALNADYWKPVQAGSLEHTDSDEVGRFLTSSSGFTAWPEAYRLTQPMSPHAAAEHDGVQIQLKDILAPAQARKNLVIELAGGLMVPLSETLSTVDLIEKLAMPVVLVANYYLGSINHSLLSIHLLRALKLPILGIVFNGETNTQSRDIILTQGQLALLGEIPQAEKIDQHFIQQHAQEIRKHPAMARL